MLLLIIRKAFSIGIHCSCRHSLKGYVIIIFLWILQMAKIFKRFYHSWMIKEYSTFCLWPAIPLLYHRQAWGKSVFHFSMGCHSKKWVIRRKTVSFCVIVFTNLWASRVLYRGNQRELLWKFFSLLLKFFVKNIFVIFIWSSQQNLPKQSSLYKNTYMIQCILQHVIYKIHIWYNTDYFHFFSKQIDAEKD